MCLSAELVAWPAQQPSASCRVTEVNKQLVPMVTCQQPPSPPLLLGQCPLCPLVGLGTRRRGQSGNRTSGNYLPSGNEMMQNSQGMLCSRLGGIP